MIPRPLRMLTPSRVYRSKSVSKALLLGGMAAFCRRHHIRTLAVFGSALREDFRPDSDVDLLVVVSDRARKEALERRLEVIRTLALDRFGVPVSLLLLTSHELTQRVRTRSRFIREVLEEGRVVAGRPISDVARSA